MATTTARGRSAPKKKSRTPRTGKAAKADKREAGLLMRFFTANGRLGGFLLLAFAIAGWVSIAGWHVDDPSFSYASGQAAQNPLGFAGSALADLLLQAFGVFAVIALLPLASLGWHLLRAKTLSPLRLRFAAFVALLPFGSAALATAPIHTAWPLPSGLGGFVGDLVLTTLAGSWIGGAPGGWMPLAIGAALGAVSLALLWFAGAFALFSIGLNRPDAPLLPERPDHLRRAPIDEDDIPYGEDDEEGESRFDAIQGALYHTVLTWKARLQRVSRRKDSAVPPAGVRSEPVLQRTGPSPAAGASSRIARPQDPALQWESDNDAFLGAPDAGIRDDRGPEDDDAFDIDPPGDHDDHGDPFAEAGGRNEPRLRRERDEDDDAPWLDADRDEHGTDKDDGDDGDDRDWPENEDAPVSNRIVPFKPRLVHSAEPEPKPKPRSTVSSQQPEPEAVTRRVPAPPPPASPELDGHFDMPELEFLAEPKAVSRDSMLTEVELEENARQLEGVLEDFGVRGEIIQVRPGPVVTLYELEPAPGIKSSRVIGLAEDIARSMSAISARVAVVPGRNAIGIELPNQKRQMVYLRELLASRDFQETKTKLGLSLGKTIGGEGVIADLAKMPHLLVAGTTGSGKSVAVNTMILSLLYRLTPAECRLIMIDPKMLELSIYDGIPHLLSPVVTDPKKAVVALKWTVREMEDRYRKMSKVGVRNIDGFNARVKEAQENGETITRTVQTGFDRETGEAIYESEDLDLDPIPYIVVIIDEMADLMMVAGKDIEGAVQRLAQMARAAGIHVIMATQRPSVDVITGTIKANFPTRISFQVTSKIDSRTILGEQGAEQLLGMGDMLYMAGGGRTQRVHGPFVSDKEVEAVVNHLKLQGVPDYLDAVTEDEEEGGGDGGSASSGGGDGNVPGDDPYDQAVAVVLRDGKASTSYIQRRLGIGYNRAASLIERMENEGVIGPANHAGKREILVPTEEEAY